MLKHSVLRLSFLCLSFSAVLSCLLAEDAPTTRRRLLNAFESGSYSRAGSWKMQKVGFLPVGSGGEAKLGEKQFRFSGVAEIKGAKGDCSIYGGKLASIAKLSIWVKLDPDSNVAKLGFQTRDRDGEGLFVLFDADWTGWRKLETDLVSGLEQAWKQADKNGAVDYPVNGVNLVWFTKEPGDTHLDVDALELVENVPADSGRIDRDILFPEWSPEGCGGAAVAILNNSRKSKEDVEMELVVQEDPALFNKTPPDPVLGSDHALGCKGWLIFDDKRTEDISLTDGDENSNASTEWTNEHYTEASQIVALGREINVKEIKFKSGDANWLWRMDVLASDDGENFSPVPELQDVNMHKRWGEFALGIKTPFKAKFIKLHYRTEPGKKEAIIRMPAAMMAYDGAEEEKFNLPETGRRILAEKKNISVPPCDYVVEKIAIPALPQGAYLLSAVIRYGGRTELLNSNYFSFKDAEKSLGEKSRFGINGSDIGAIPFHRQLGLGWARFENMKWAFISPEKGKFAFDGSVAPWHVKEDEIIKGYTEAGLSYLPYVFQTPRWASSAPEGHKNSRGFPPKDFGDYGDCIFQIVARYGSAKHPEGALQTNDKASGMGILKVIELWNEPNLNAESWGPWVDSIERYFDIFRIGAEAAKKADPAIKVTSCGWAGIRLDVVSKMHSYKYPDGKCPADFADILNVHFYSGRSDPETCFVDPNVQRGSRKPGPEDNDYETELKYLCGWWNVVKPGAPIWLTETGYDVGGPIGRDERYQAAKLPRCLMMALAAGIEKVFVYREIGSTPSQHAGSGLIREDRSYRPSFFTYATLIRELDGVEPGRVRRLMMKDNPSIWLYLWNRGGERILTAWSLDENSLLPLDLGDCIVTDAFGRTESRKIQSDLKLGIFPVYIKKIGNFSGIAELQKEAESRDMLSRQERDKFLKLKKHIFDFGSTEFVGKLKRSGVPLEYQAVLSGDVFDEKKGWGFDKAALGDNIAKWMESATDKDTCRVRDHMFMVRTLPGTYDVEVHASPFGKNSSLTVKGAGGDIVLATSKESPLASAKIKSDGMITFLFKDLFNVAWIRIIEEEQ